MAQLKITLVKSTIGALKDQKATVESLGLKKINSFTVQPDNACSRSKIFKLYPLLKVEEA